MPSADPDAEGSSTTRVSPPTAAPEARRIDGPTRSPRTRAARNRMRIGSPAHSSTARLAVIWVSPIRLSAYARAGLRSPSRLSSRPSRPAGMRSPRSRVIRTSRITLLTSWIGSSVSGWISTTACLLTTVPTPQHAAASTRPTAGGSVSVEANGKKPARGAGLAELSMLVSSGTGSRDRTDSHRTTSRGSPPFHASRLSGQIGSGRLGCAHDRGVHALGDLVRRHDLHIGEAHLSEAGPELAEGERAGDAAHVAAALRALLRGQQLVGDDVADPDPPTRL